MLNLGRFYVDISISNCQKDAMMIFHDSSRRECCILCHGDTAAVNEETDVCECGPGSKAGIINNKIYVRE